MEAWRAPGGGQQPGLRGGLRNPGQPCRSVPELPVARLETSKHEEDGSHLQGSQDSPDLGRITGEAGKSPHSPARALPKVSLPKLLPTMT